MLDVDHWQEILDALSRSKLRTALTAFGVFWGIFLLVVMLGAGKGLWNGVRAGFAASATNSVFIWGGSTTIPHKGLPVGRRVRLRTDDVAAVRSRVADVDVAAPSSQLGGFRGGNNVSRGTKAGAFSVTGEVPEILRVKPFRMLAGRYLNPLDGQEHRKVAVIGTRVRDVLFGEGSDPLGGQVRINGVEFLVVGMFEGMGRGDSVEEDAQRIHVPLTTFQRAFHQGDRIGWISLTARAGATASLVEERALSVLRSRHGVSPDDRRAIGSYNLEEEFEKIQSLFSGIAALTWLVGLGTLSAGAIGVSNIMLIVVRERTREIGIRRAVGATPAGVMGQIVLEAVLLTSVAGMAGIVAGVGLLEAVAAALGEDTTGQTMFERPGVDLMVILRALLILVASGVLAGALPAQRAVAVRPVDAIRTEI